MKELTGKLREVLPKVQDQCTGNAYEEGKQVEAERRKARQEFGGMLEDEDEAAFDARKAKAEKSEAGKGPEPRGVPGKEDIGKPYVLGANFVLVIVWNGNELAAPNGKGVLPAEFARTLYEFTTVCKIWPHHVILVSPSSSLWKVSPEYGALFRAAVASLKKHGLNVVSSIPFYSALKQYTIPENSWHFNDSMACQAEWKKMFLRI